MIVGRVTSLLPAARIGYRGTSQIFFSTTTKRQGHHSHGPKKDIPYEQALSEWDPTHGRYRDYGRPWIWHEVMANCCGTFFWWWFFYHCFTDYQHITGHHILQDYETWWTDKELGIPPLSDPDPEDM